MLLIEILYTVVARPGYSYTAPFQNQFDRRAWPRDWRESHGSWHGIFGNRLTDASQLWYATPPATSAWPAGGVVHLRRPHSPPLAGDPRAASSVWPHAVRMVASINNLSTTSLMDCWLRWD